MSNDAFSARSRVDLHEQVDYYSNVDRDTFALKQGGYCTVLEMRGTRRSVTPDSLKNQINSLRTVLGSMFNRQGVKIDMSFTRDKDRSLPMLKETLGPAIASSQNVGLDAGPLFDDMIETMMKFIAYEGGIIAIKTSISALKPVERKRLSAQKKAKQILPIIAKEGANPSFEVGRSLKKTHETNVNVFSTKVSEYWDVKILTCEEAMHSIRREVSAEMTPPTWRPILWGGPIPIRMPCLDDEDISHVVPPMFGVQLLPQKPLPTDDSSIIKVGSKYICPLYFEQLPVHLSQFNDLFSVLDQSLPFRYTVSFETGGNLEKRKVANQKMLAQLFSMGSSHNKDIVDSCEYILDKMEKKVPHVQVSATMVTWADNLELARERKIQLVQEVATWGGPELRDSSDYPIGVWFDSIPGLATTSLVVKNFWSFDDLWRLLPLDRPAGIWKTGSLLYRSADGKLLPWEPFSNRQTTWSGLKVGIPGYGKTVSVLAQLLAGCFASGLTKLPRQALLDIGHSTEGYIDLLQAMLPEGDKNQALMVVMDNEGFMRINPLDIPIGYSTPPQEDKDYVMSFIEALVTPVSGPAEEIVVEAACSMVNRLYARRIEKPEAYESYILPAVHEEITKNADKYNLPDEPYWFEIRDALFAAGKLELAEAAHRLAVPNLNDCSRLLVEDEELLSAYEDALIASGEPVLSVLKRSMGDALENYKILAGPSTFDFGPARIIAFNLRKVAGQQSAKAIKKTNIMYELAKKAAAKGFFATDESLEQCPVAYREYHEKIARANMGQRKSLLYEEFHVPAKATHDTNVKAPIVRSAENESKTGRKSSVGIDAVSQQLDDFTEQLIENASTIQLLYAGDKKIKDKIKKMYDLENDVITSMGRFLTGPTSEGAPIFSIYKIKKEGVVIQEAFLSLGSLTLWALCSTEGDVFVRRDLASKIGFYDALQKLGNYFPGGSIGSAEEKFKNALALIGGELGREAQERWVSVFVDHLNRYSRIEFQAILDGRRPLDKSLLN